MAKAGIARELHDSFPSAATHLQRLVEAAAGFSAHPDARKVQAFDAAFAETVRALAKDAPGLQAETYRQSLLELLAAHREAFPDRQEPCRFLERILNAERAFAESQIKTALAGG